MATEEEFVCESCIDAVVASAKVAGRITKMPDTYICSPSSSGPESPTTSARRMMMRKWIAIAVAVLESCRGRIHSGQ